MVTAMTICKEHPILFNSEMVRAILAGRKTQTRQVFKFPVFHRLIRPSTDQIGSINPDGNGGWIAWGPHPVRDEDSRRLYPNGGGIRCPYGQPGDRLWVRETWQTSKVYDYSPPRQIDGAASVKWQADGEERINNISDAEDWGRVRPSIHMPRWASRITLEVVDVRVEQVQDIGREDAISEGLYRFTSNLGARNSSPVALYAPSPGDEGGYMSPIEAFESLWDSINAKRGHAWNSNPWVWVVEFRKCAVTA